LGSRLRLTAAEGMHDEDHAREADREREGDD
jgi:hypothetical protein